MKGRAGYLVILNILAVVSIAILDCFMTIRLFGDVSKDDKAIIGIYFGVGLTAFTIIIGSLFVSSSIHLLKGTTKKMHQIVAAALLLFFVIATDAASFPVFAELGRKGEILIIYLNVLSVAVMAGTIIAMNISKPLNR